MVLPGSRRSSRWAVSLTVGLLLVAGGGMAQQSARRSTNLASLLNYPAFYQMRPIVMIGTVTLSPEGQLRVTDETGGMPVVFKGTVPEGLAEVRGEFWDIGRMNADDPRLASLDIRATFKIDPEAPWPRPGQVMAIIASAISPAAQPGVPSIRSMVLFPARYREQRVTVAGQFAGRNLLGDLPDAPARSRYDFVLRSADAAIWVSNLRPRGKDFELALDARIDTGRWLEVTGVLQQGRGLQWLDGEMGSVKLTTAPDAPADESPVQVMPAPPPEVVFSAPTEGETDVAANSSIRIQFSRDIAPASLKGRVRVEYVTGADAARGSGAPITGFTTDYRGAARVLEVKFTQPLDRLRTVRVSFADGVSGTDQQPLKPWTLTFDVGP